MISVSFNKDESGNIMLHLQGHAGAGARGHDVICAGASMLCYTLAQVMQYMWEEKELSKKPQINLKEGDSFISAKPVDEHYNQCLHAFFVVQAGYALLAHSYPQYVELISFGDSSSEED